MAYMDFIRLYAQDVKKTPEDLLSETPLSFPVSTNQRGESFVQFLRGKLKTPMPRVRALDIGCAYGGHCLALAKAQARVVGFDVNPKLITYAQANAKGVAEIDFRVADASSVAIRKQFGKGAFNLVILNDVLEHIYDTTSLFDNLDYLLDGDGIVFFKVPNGYSPRFVMSEGHRKIFALTLLDPDCWFHLYPKRASVFYRPFAYFTSIASHFGFKDAVLFDNEEVLRRFTAKKLRRQIKEIFVKAREFNFPDAVTARLVRERIVRFRDDFDFEIEARPEDAVKFKYGSYFYTGFFARRAGLIEESADTLRIEGFPRIVSEAHEALSAA
jgi:2-polyprenyl-3-methyl-5-hydroxy-6-metoxy-1,4-benzoquinol methylase